MVEHECHESPQTLLHSQEQKKQDEFGHINVVSIMKDEH